MRRETTYSTIAVLFIISGATGLMYQIAWFKYLSLFLGNTTYAQTIVLATFMGGLAIGASLWGRRVDAARSPLMLYSGLEFFIGVYCILYPLFLFVIKSLFVSAVHWLNLPSDSASVLFLKLLASILTLLPPTIFMGGTLPVLVRFVSHSVEESGKNVATLYFLNSFGAVVGSILGGFFFIPMVGLQATVTSAGIVNVLIAGVAFIISRKSAGLLPGEVTVQAEPAESSVPDRTIALAVGVAGISGLAAMIYEVTWVRLLIPVLGSSTYSYTLMLVAFISGITIGSLIIGTRIGRLRNLVGALALCQILIGISMALMLPLYGRIPYVFWLIGSMITRSDATYPIYLTMQFLIGFTIMIVPTVFLGMSLPLASRIATRSVVVLGRSVGTVFSVNTLGTVIGSLAAGLVLIPLIGVRHAIEVGLLLNLACGIALALFDGRSTRVRKYALSGLGLLFGCLTFVVGSDWNQMVTLSGVFRQFGRGRTPPSSYAEFEQISRSNRVLFYKEGVSATIGVLEYPGTTGSQNVLLINGKVDASSEGDLPTQVLLGQVPMLFHPSPDTVLVIGFGSGVTAGSVLTHPVKSLESVEISPEVIEAAAYFEHVNNRPILDPRMRLTIDDALAFLKLSGTNYDVIISEPSNPWIAGIGNLYTTEFFELSRQRLRPQGLMVQWFHLYEIDDATFKLVVRTFSAVFPHVTIWQSLAYDVLLIGSQEPIVLNEGDLKRKFEIPAVKADLDRIEVRDPVTILSLEMVSERPVREYAGSGPLNTENKPVLEYSAPRAFFVNRGARDLGRFDERQVFGRSNLFLDQLMKKRAMTEAERLNIGLLHATVNRGSGPLGYAMLSDYLKTRPKDVHALTTMASLVSRMGRVEEQIGILERAAEAAPNDPVILEQYAWAKFTDERSLATSQSSFDASVSERLLERCVKLTGDTAEYYRVRLGDLNFGIQNYRDALDNYRHALQLTEMHSPDRRVQQDVLLLQMARCFRHLGDPGRAIGYALQATNANPRNEEARELIWSIWLVGGASPADTTSRR
jgi:spermidine synthase